MKESKEKIVEQGKKTSWRPVEEANKRGKRKQSWYDELETRMVKLSNKNRWVEKAEEEQRREDEAYVDKEGIWQCSVCESRQHVIKKECERCDKTRDVLHRNDHRRVEIPERKRKREKGPKELEDMQFEE